MEELEEHMEEQEQEDMAEVQQDLTVELEQVELMGK